MSIICQSRRWRQDALGAPCAPLHIKPRTSPRKALSIQRKQPKAATTKTLTLLLSIIISLASMSFLSKFLRPFTSSSMSSAPAQPMSIPANAQTATVAAGCFWGVEHMYRREFKNRGLYDARVGYIGGDSQNPSYRAVCSGQTGRKLPSLQTRWDGS